MAHILLGTSGYSYADWVGPFYPPGTSPEDFLQRYAESFDFVELNFSYYRQPDSRTVERLRAKVPETFRFSAKAHRSLTHEPGTAIDEASRAFLEGLRPLVESGQLSAALLQFPFSFHYTVEARRRLDELCARLGTLPLAVEFRNRDWHREKVFAGLRSRGVALASVDLPPLPELPGPDLHLTSNLGYVRFHGRRASTWWTGDSTSRYDYAYTANELEEWARRLVGALENLSVLVIAFNNHYHAQAAANALQLRSLLSSPGGASAGAGVAGA